MKGPRTSYRCRSEPQIPLDVTRMIASVGAWMLGSGTVSTRTSRRPCQVTALMPRPYPAAGAETLARMRPALGAHEDLRDHRALGLGVVVRGVPVAPRQLALGV